jgi:hypothetical protein
MMTKPTRRTRTRVVPAVAQATDATEAERARLIGEVVERCASDEAFKLRLLTDLTAALSAAGVELRVDGPSPEPAAGTGGGGADETPRLRVSNGGGAMPVDLRLSGRIRMKIGAIYLNLNTDSGGGKG